MEEKSNLPGNFLEGASEYGKTTFELLKLKSLDKLTDIASSVASRSVSIILFAIFFLFASAGLAYWLGDILGKVWYGFAIVAAFYGIVGVLVHFLFHKSIKKRIADLIVREALK